MIPFTLGFLIVTGWPASYRVTLSLRFEDSFYNVAILRSFLVSSTFRVCYCLIAYDVLKNLGHLQMSTIAHVRHLSKEILTEAMTANRCL